MGITERRHEFNINCAKKADGTYTRDYSNLTKLQRKKNNISAHLAFASFWQKQKSEVKVRRKLKNFEAKSVYRSHKRSHFYGREYEIWADFGPIGNTEKK